MNVDFLVGLLVGRIGFDKIDKFWIEGNYKFQGGFFSGSD